jgi:hypothetical protein
MCTVRAGFSYVHYRYGGTKTATRRERREITYYKIASAFSPLQGTHYADSRNSRTTAFRRGTHGGGSQYGVYDRTCRSIRESNEEVENAHVFAGAGIGSRALSRARARALVRTLARTPARTLVLVSSSPSANIATSVAMRQSACIGGSVRSSSYECAKAQNGVCLR